MVVETRLSHQKTSATLPVKYPALKVRYGKGYDQTARGTLTRGKKVRNEEYGKTN